MIRLAEPLPLHLLYMTAWVDSAGTLQFRNDIYKRDSDLDRALRQRPPIVAPQLGVTAGLFVDKESVQIGQGVGQIRP